jgi:hypothetical protein
MASIGLNYNVHTSPSSVNAYLGFSFSGATLKATINSVDDFIVTLTPTGNVASEILSGIVYPVASLLGVALPPLGKSIIYGYSFDAMTISNGSVNVQGNQVNIAPCNLNMGTYGDMVMITGDVNVY